MRHRRKGLIWCFLLWLGAALAAQESPPESKSESQRPMRVRVSQRVAEALIVKKVQPEYPQEAREKRIEGEVVLKILISPQGDVSDVSLISGLPLLAPAAIEAVKQWKYKPYLLNGHPVEVETKAVVSFKLDSSGQTNIPQGNSPSSATGIVGDTPGGISCGQMGAAIAGIVSSEPVLKPSVASPERVRVSQGVTQGLLVKRVNPEYPPEARRGRIEGTVCLRVIINKAGDIATVDVISGHPALAPVAIEAVKQWKYKPYLLQGKPVEVQTQILVNFTLSGN